ncbi:MAG: PQQ-binding-like beta-propeller repeat protein [Candidatus Latescibacteria bacterium]|nr:PQQ-binding-like beta-propeller repeat protein [Candidatus Latescibacterota bacterium]
MISMPLPPTIGPISLSTICWLVLCVGLCSCRTDGPQEIREQHRTWADYGGGSDQSKYFVQDQITRANVSQLEVAFTYSTNDDRTYQNNPIIVDDIMYVMAKDNSLVAIDATSGEEIWIHAKLNGITRRGITYWENEDRSDRRIIFTRNLSLQAIDAVTGKSILTFGEEGIVDLRQGLGRDPNEISRIAPTTPGRIFENLLVLGSFPGEGYLSAPGHIRAFDVVTGEMAWVFHTIPQPGEYGYETWPPEAYKYVGGVNCWSEISIDEDRGIAYVPLGSPTYDYYGADRIGANLFATSLVALDVRTGERIWHFQTVHHDLWDYDLASAPQLFTVDRDGKRVDAVAVATKAGFMFAFERDTGEPLWPIEERPVPPSTMPGEEAWPTQPIPAKLPPFTRQEVSAKDVTPLFFTDEEHGQWQQRVASARKGRFMPPDSTETIVVPGAVGGANWGNTAANPEKGLVYVLSMDYPSFYKLSVEGTRRISPRRQARIDRQESIARGATAYETHCQSCHGSDLAGTGLGPSLLTMGSNLDLQHLQRTVLNGIGRMRPVLHIQEEEIVDILALLADRATSALERSAEVDIPDGPVVAAGGAPGEANLRSTGRSRRGRREYPEGIDVPAQRYRTGYGLDHPYILNPPWSSITAYDMNKGTIKWTRPHGEEPEAVAKGARNTGVPDGIHGQGMIVTSNGIIFATVNNGQIYAYDADNGNILWRAQTELGIGTLSSMYEVDGRIYLVINATKPLKNDWTLPGQEEAEDALTEEDYRGEYVVFSLPQ